MGNAIREGSGSGSAKAAVWGNPADKGPPSWRPVQPRKASTDTARAEARAQEREGGGDGGGVDYEVQSRVGGSAGCCGDGLAKGTEGVVPKNLEGPITTTVIGGRSAKTTRTEMIIQNGHIPEVNRLIRTVTEDPPKQIDLALCRQPRG